jgi:hypothetical protein
MLHPGMGQYFDYPDAASIAAPKPMQFFAGKKDPLFPVPSVQAAFDAMKDVWQASGSPKTWNPEFGRLPTSLPVRSRTRPSHSLKKPLERKR